MITRSPAPRPFGAKPRMKWQDCAPTLRMEIAEQCARRDVYQPTQHHEVSRLHRFGDFFARHYPQVELADIRREHIVTYLDWQKATFRRGNRQGGKAIYQLFEDAQAAGRYPANVRNPWKAGSGETLTYELPAATRDLLDELDDELENEVERRIDSDGKEGRAESYRTKVMGALREFLDFVAVHNKKVEEAAKAPSADSLTLPAEGEQPEAKWSLLLPELFSDPTPLYRFLREKTPVRRTRNKGEYAKTTKRLKQGQILAAYYILNDLKGGGIGAADFPEQLDRKATRRRGRKKKDFGGAEARVIESLSPDEIAAVYAVLEQRLGNAEKKLAEAKTADEISSARGELREALVAYAMWELAFWSGMRPATLVSLDLQYLARTRAGSWYFAAANFKASEAEDFGDQWISPRAARTLARLLELDGLQLERKGKTEEEAWGPAIHLRRGDHVGRKQMAGDRVFYPGLRTASGKAQSIDNASGILMRVLETAGCHETEARQVRHAMAAYYLNELRRSVTEVMEIGHWKSQKVVYRHYTHRNKESTWEAFDALTEDVLQTRPSESGAFAARIASGLVRFLSSYADGQGGQHSVHAVWETLVDALDALTAVDPGLVSPKRAIFLPSKQWAALDAEVMRVTGRKHSLRSIARRVLGDVPPVGLAAPRPGITPPAAFPEAAS